MLLQGARSAGLSSTQAQTLLALSAADHPLKAGQLAEEFGSSAATISEVLNALERKTLIERRHGREDRRQVYVSLTEQGRKLASRLVGWDGLMERAVGELPVGDREVLFRSVVHLLASLERNDLIHARACPTCVHFTADASAAPDHGHFCALTQRKLTDLEMRLDCPDFAMRS